MLGLSGQARHAVDLAPLIVSSLHHFAQLETHPGQLYDC